MYFGWWTALFGLIIIYRTWLVVVFLSSLFVFSRRARLEEKILAERFGEKWHAYVRRTKSLVPFLY
ncbi:MAG: hypothetical protein GX493_05620 [Firmicutes bacterium]|nr:hypothetical protein [Bacillota bacterium]